jgi:predicted AAA+ superfamily ATPase
MMIQRRLMPVLQASLGRFPVVALVGSRQTGKTTLAREIARGRQHVLYLDLERPADLARLEDAEYTLRRAGSRLVIIDEVQRRPDLFPLLRSLVDDSRRNGRFLLLGSASPALLRQSSESLAGRIVYHELPPFGLGEVAEGVRAVDTLWLRGGYPRSFLAPSAAASLEWREAFIATYLERDLPQLGVRVPAAQMRPFWQMLAHLHGQIWNASAVARSLGVSAPTAGHYLAILEDTFIVRRLQPYHANLSKRLIKSPKIYFRDSGLLHALLPVVTAEQLLGHPVRGASWEGFVIEQIITLAPPAWRHFFFRTVAGAEIDMVAVPPGKPPVPVEIKATLAPVLSRGFRQGFADLGAARGFVVYAGDEVLPLAPGIEAIPITEVQRIFARRKRAS